MGRSTDIQPKQSETGRVDQTDVVSVAGLGYVGLPLAYEFDRAGHEVIGYDVDPERVAQLRSGEDPTGDVGDEAVANCDVLFTDDESKIADSDFVLVAVPTPVSDLKNPNLKFVESAGKTIGRHIESGTTVVLESTVYPGATREILIPAIESTSGLNAGEEFSVGYSPERMVPGNEEHGLRNVVKIVSGQTEKVTEEVAELYETIVDAGVHRAPSIETAETAKVVENTQRDLNIALMNELAVACEHLGLDTQAVLEAAGTKWNFHEYQPGLVGGHCIPVDPFYLIYESKQNGFSPELIEKGREINEFVPKHIGSLTIKALNESENVLKNSRVLILGLAYKPNVGDIRTSAIDGVIHLLEDYGIDVVGYDPHADNEEIREEFGITVQDELDVTGFDGIVIGTAHDKFYGLKFEDIAEAMAENPVLIDVDGVFEEYGTTGEFTYRRL